MSESLNVTRFNAWEAKLLIESLERAGLDQTYPKIYAALDAFSKNAVTFEPSQDGYAESQFAYAKVIEQAANLEGNNLPIQLKILKTLLETPAAEQATALRALQREKRGWFSSLEKSNEATLFNEVIDATQETPVAVMAPDLNENPKGQFRKSRKKKKKRPTPIGQFNKTTSETQPETAEQPTDDDVATSTDPAATTEAAAETTDPKEPYRVMLRESREMAEALGEQGEALIKEIETQTRTLEGADFSDRPPSITSKIEADHGLIQSVYKQKVQETKQAIQALHTEAETLYQKIISTNSAPDDLAGQHTFKIALLGETELGPDASLKALREKLKQGRELIGTLQAELEAAEAKAEADKQEKAAHGVAAGVAAGILKGGIEEAKRIQEREAYKEIAGKAASIGAAKGLEAEKQRLGKMLGEAEHELAAYTDGTHESVHHRLQSLRTQLQAMTDPGGEEGRQLASEIEHFLESAKGANKIASRPEEEPTEVADQASPQNSTNGEMDGAADTHSLDYLNETKEPSDALQASCYHEWQRLSMKTLGPFRKKRTSSHELKLDVLRALGPAQLDNRKSMQAAEEALGKIIKSDRKFNRFAKGFQKFLDQYAKELEEHIQENSGVSDGSAALLETVNALKAQKNAMLPSFSFRRGVKRPRRSV